MRYFLFIINLLNKFLVAIVVVLITVYRFMISPVIGANCRFSPTCSEYAKEAFEKYGIWYGGWLTIKRLCSCHPFHKGGYDPVP
ncbi:MAG: membrane protein insertion efficiency factor YidD [Gammaproteobacteria bacterium GWE2_37_16]|nr:MAG: membrane protein insertion efficiency factor YidD [Gammaproteobacteria bacterium GWE2_37_16]